MVQIYFTKSSKWFRHYHVSWFSFQLKCLADPLALPGAAVQTLSLFIDSHSRDDLPKLVYTTKTEVGHRVTYAT